MEGRYYLFHYDELLTLLGDEKGRAFNAYYGITPQGNFEGGSIPNRLHPTAPEGAFDDVLPAVRTYRRERDSLHLDDKILTAWNALMIAALAFLYRITGAPRYLDAAKTAQRFLDTHLSDENGLYVSFREGKRTARGFLDEYAFSAAAQLMLFDATLEEAYLRRAEQFCRQAASFADPDAGGFHLTGDANERLVIRPKETYDGALPSGNAVMAFNFVRLSQLTQEDDWEQACASAAAFLSGEAASFPAGHSCFCWPCCCMTTAALGHRRPGQRRRMGKREKAAASLCDRSGAARADSGLPAAQQPHHLLRLPGSCLPATLQHVGFIKGRFFIPHNPLCFSDMCGIMTCLHLLAEPS